MTTATLADDRRTIAPMERLAATLADDLAAVDAALAEHMNSSTPLIPQVAAHLVQAGGKRVRPVLTLAAARLCGYEGEDHIRLAAAVEFIHSATLLHDDVVDGSALRRGKPAANTVFGNKPSILVGDFLFSRAFQLMVQTGSIEVLDILSATSAIISAGEVMQMVTANNLATTEAEHLAVIRAKTAALFAAAAEVGGVLAGVPREQQKALDTYGDRLGIAFQLADDALDYAGKAGTIGKDAGDDFREGKVTQPVLRAYAAANDEERAFWQRTVEKRRQEDGDFEHAMALLDRHGAITGALDDARRYGDEARAAIRVFPPSDLRDDLDDLVGYVVDRDH
jgi:octaprenyl-diphosphate synthase